MSALALTRFELARRGNEPWAQHYRRFKEEAGELPPGPEGFDTEKGFVAWVEALTADQRQALRRLLHAFAGPPKARRGHGHGTDSQRRGCECGPCDPFGERAGTRVR